MSIKLMSQVWALEVRGVEAMLLLRLADFANDEGTRIFPSLGRLAWDCGLSKRTVQRRLQAWLKRGALVVVRAGGGRGYATEYALNLAAFPTKRALPPELRATEALWAEILVRDGQRCRSCNLAGTDALGPDGRKWRLVRSVPRGPWSETNTRLVCASCDDNPDQRRLPLLMLDK